MVFMKTIPESIAMTASRRCTDTDSGCQAWTGDRAAQILIPAVRPGQGTAAQILIAVLRPGQGTEEVSSNKFVIKPGKRIETASRLPAKKGDRGSLKIQTERYSLKSWSKGI
jgi:hypothetical protein